MSNIAKKIANRNYDENGTAHTRSTSKHGVGRVLRRIVSKRNRAAIREEKRRAVKESGEG